MFSGVINDYSLFQYYAHVTAYTISIVSPFYQIIRCLQMTKKLTEVTPLSSKTLCPSNKSETEKTCLCITIDKFELRNQILKEDNEFEW